MDLFKKFSREKTKTEEINDKRAQLKKQIAQNLKNIGFSAKEIDEVISILNKSEEEIQIEKDSLIGTNINNEHTIEITNSTLAKIREMELLAAQEMRLKIMEIQQRKQNNS